MSDTGKVVPSELATHIVELILEVNVASRTWAQLYITVVGGFAVGGGAVISFWNAQFEQITPYFGTVPLFLFLLGGMLSATISSIIIRAHKWQSWFTKRLNEVTTGEPVLTVYPTEKGIVEAQDAGYIGSLVKWANRVIVIAFFAAAITMAWIICANTVGVKIGA